MNKKILIGIIIIVIIAIVGVFLYFGSANVTMETTDASIKLSSNYMIDKNGVAHCNDIGVSFVSLTGYNQTFLNETFSVLKTKGESAGYKNIIPGDKKINGYTIYELGGNPNDIKKVSSDKTYGSDVYTWTEYDPLIPTFSDFTDMKVVNFRDIVFVNDKTGKMNELIIFTNNTSTDLYSSEIQDIINSISALES